MTKALLRLMRVRQRLVQRATALVETRRRFLDQARATLAHRDRLIEALERQCEQASAWLTLETSDPALRMTALARIDALADHRTAASQARAAEAAMVADAAGQLREAQQRLGKAKARLAGLEALASARGSAAERRRERQAEFDQERLLSPAETGGDHELIAR